MYEFITFLTKVKLLNRGSPEILIDLYTCLLHEVTRRSLIRHIILLTYPRWVNYLHMYH